MNALSWFCLRGWMLICNLQGARVQTTPPASCLHPRVFPCEGKCGESRAVPIAATVW